MSLVSALHQQTGRLDWKRIESTVAVDADPVVGGRVCRE